MVPNNPTNPPAQNRTHPSQLSQMSHVTHNSTFQPADDFFKPRVCVGPNCPQPTHVQVGPNEFRSIGNDSETLYGINHPNCNVVGSSGIPASPQFFWANRRGVPRRSSAESRNR